MTKPAFYKTLDLNIHCTLFCKVMWLREGWALVRPACPGCRWGRGISKGGRGCHLSANMIDVGTPACSSAHAEPSQTVATATGRKRKWVDPGVSMTKCSTTVAKHSGLWVRVIYMNTEEAFHSLASLWFRAEWMNILFVFLGHIKAACKHCNCTSTMVRGAANILSQYRFFLLLLLLNDGYDSV